MKKSIILSIIAGTFAYSIHAQTKFDGSYSSSNYKQPNKAAIARKLNLDKNLIMAYAPGIESNLFDNYKNTFAEIANNGGGELPILPLSSGTGLVSEANYKLENKKVLRKEPALQPDTQQPVVMSLE